MGVALLGAIGTSAAFGPPDGLAQVPPDYGYGYGYGYENPTPTSTATSSPTGTPTASPTATPTATPKPDKKPPKCKPKIRKRQTPKSVRRKGVRMKGRCDEAARVRVRAFVPARTARKLGIKPKARKRVLVGSRRRALPANRQRDLTVRMRRKAAAPVGGARKVSFAVVMDAADAAGNRGRVTRAVTVRRRR